jgi:hypothetical protein
MRFFAYSVVSVKQAIAAPIGPRDAVARLREAAERTFQTLHVRQAVRVRHAHVVEEQAARHRRAQAHLLVDFLRRKTLGVRRHDEALDAVIGLRPDDRDVGEIAVGDPHFGAVDDPVAAVLLRARLHVGRVGAAVRFGQAEAADDLARRHLRQPVLLLLFAAVGVDRIHAQRRLHRGEAADAGIAAFEFLAGQAIADAVHARAAVFGRQRRAEQAEFGHFRYEFDRETALVEAVADDRQHALVGEARDGVLHHAFFFAEQGADVVKVGRVERCGRHGGSGRAGKVR